MAAAYLDQDERLSYLDSALKDCIQQISSLQEEREANNRLVRSLLCKQELVEELERDKLHLEAQLDALIHRVDAVEKENAFLKCECCALERELLLRPESANKLMNHFREDSGKQIVPVLEAYTDEIATLKHGHWPWNVLDMILEEHQESNRSINGLLEEIRSSLSPQREFNLNESICRMIELIEEISPVSLVSSTTCSDANLDYSVHVLRWRNCELVPILRRFVLSCSLVMNGSYGIEDFAMQLMALLEWAVGNCITLDDASRVRGGIRKHFGLDRPKSERGLDIASVESQNVMSKMIKIQCDLQEENKWLKAANDCLRIRLEESKVSVGRLRDELEGLEESNRIVEDQSESQKLINEDLDTQLSVSKAKQNEMARRISALEVELEDKNQSYEELETTCLELQLQLEILSRKGTPDQEKARFENDNQTGSETETELGTKQAEFQQHDKEKSKQHHSLLDILMLTDDDDTKTEARASCVGDAEKQKTAYGYCPDTTAARVITVVSSQTSGGGFGFAKKLFMNLQKNASTLKRSKRSYSSSAVDEFDL